MDKIQDLKIALIHDFLDQYGGAERVLEVMSEMFPEAPIYTLLYDKEKMSARGGSAFGGHDRKIYTSFLQRFPKFIRKRKKWLLPLLPIAPETFDLRDFDMVISSSGAWSKGIITRLRTIHIAYLHSPMRFVWDEKNDYLKQQKKFFLVNFFTRILLNYIRIWDKLAADRPDYIISNSIYTKKRIKKYYGRESEVIYPPVGDETWNMESEANKDEKNSRGEYFLIVSRLSSYKKIDAAIDAFNKMDLPLWIVGEGTEKKYLQSIASKNIKFLGWQSDKKLSGIYSKARAFIFPGIDDFGIAPVEAMSFGVPILSLRKGGILEINTEGVTGEYFNDPTPEVIADAVRRFMEKENGYKKEVIIAKAKEFSSEIFKKNFGKFVGDIKNQNFN
jgi:glycosyltransferase involved in cell wall biosynthesis